MPFLISYPHNLKWLTVGALLFALSTPTEAQQLKKIPRIGYIAARSGPSAGERAFLEGLQSLGYIEGQTITIEWRFAQEQYERLPALATDLVQLKVDAIVTSGGNPTVRAVKNATATIPIVMTGVSDAVELGFVASLARPGGILRDQNASPQERHT
jgi:putative tryptophan/tyrosine transport system substrate-binding protein